MIGGRDGAPDEADPVESPRRQALHVGGAALFLALFIALDAGMGGDPGDRKLALWLGAVGAAALVGAALTRLDSRAMSRVMTVVAGAQVLLLFVLLWQGIGSTGPVVLINGLLAAGYGTSAVLFARDADRGDGPVGRGGSDA